MIEARSMGADHGGPMSDRPFDIPQSIHETSRRSHPTGFFIWLTSHHQDKTMNPHQSHPAPGVSYHRCSSQPRETTSKLTNCT